VSRLLLSIIILFQGIVAMAQESLDRYQYSKPAMGTTFTLIFYAPSKSQAEQVSAQAFGRIEELNHIFSDYLEQSEISQLSKKAGQKVPVSEELWYLIRLSKQISKDSDGAFDVTIGPLSRLWRRAIRQQEFPDSGRISEARKLVNYKWIKLYPASQKVKLKKAGMALDFGGIAKGYAIDEAFRILSSSGIKSVLVDGGGDLYISASPPDGSSWDIRNHRGEPMKPEPPVAIASSGDQYRYLSWMGKRFSHIVDPVKGVGLENSKVITVMAPSATIADALASALSVLPASDHEKLLGKYQANILE
jgi:thiamine biosynthesis lipoprotein